MAKIVVPNINTKFDPVAQQKAVSANLGLTPISSDEKFSLDEQAGSLNSFSNVKASDYGDNISLYSDDAQAKGILDEQRAQHQSSAEQMLKGLGHIASTMGTEILKTPGYLLGGLGAATNDKSIIENIVDNDWVNAFDSLDETIKAQMPVYLTKDVQEGNIGRKLMSSAWWATTGADGIGFLLSMYAPGRIIGALGVGAKIGAALEGIAKESKLAKVLTATNILKAGEIPEAGLKMTKKGVERINSFNAVALNTYIESASEAANTFDNVRKNVFEANPNATDEEASKIASEAAANVMKANVGVLLLSNLFDELFLFKGFGRSAEEVAKDSTLGKLFKNGIIDTEALSKIKRKGVKDFFKEVPGKLAANFAKEGLFEEGLQTKIQQHYENTASGKTNASFSEDVFGNYFESLMNDPEMQESVVLGGILGGGASMFAAASDIKSHNEFMFGKGNSMPSFLGKLLNRKEKGESKGFINIMNENFINSTRTILDIAEKDENDKPVFENGKLKVNESKLKEMVEQKDGLLLLNQLHNLAILEGNKSEETYFGDLLNYNYFLPFLQQEGGYEVLQQHISNQLVELMGKKSEAATGAAPTDAQKKELKDKLLAKAAEYKKIYDDVDTKTNTEMYVPVDDRQTYQPWKQSVRDRKMQSLVAYNSAQKALAEIDTKYPGITDETRKITKEEEDKMSPTELLDYKVASAIHDEYTKRLNTAKQAYIDLSTKKTLKEDYDKFKNEQAKEQVTLSEELEKENQGIDKAVVDQFNVADFETKINNAGYSTRKSDNIKGFYLEDQRIILEDKDGKRVTLEAQYNAATKTVDYVTKDQTGKETKVTDASGNFTPRFISKQYSPISKEQISKERTKLAFEQRKLAQLKLLKESIDVRNSKLQSHKKEIESIKEEIENYEKSLADIKSRINNLYVNKLNGKLKNKRQLKVDLASLENSLKMVEETIKNLKERKEMLEQTVPKIEALIAEYESIKAQIEASPEPFSFKKELEKIQKQISEDNFLSEIIDTISQMEKKIKILEKVRDTIKQVLASHSVFDKIIRLKEKEYEKAYGAFDRFFQDIPFSYPINRIHSMVTSSPSAVVAGETLVKNNIMTNVIEITRWLNANPVDRFIRFKTNDPITEEDVYNKIVEIFQPYVANMEELTKQYPYTPEEIYDLKSQVYATNKEIDELQKEINTNKELLSLDDTYRRYLVIDAFINNRIEKRYNEIRSEIEEKNVESSQKQDVKSVEPVSETSMREVFLQHALPQTPYSTTGKSVLYEKDGTKQGKDKIDENGFPVLNDNTFQRLWFYTIDKLSDEIQDYTLTPVKGRYDGSDEIQRVLEANFPNESQRTNHDVFVFLTDKSGEIVRVDNQGNRLKTGGTPVFTSIRKAEEVFPANQTPRVSPEYIMKEYLSHLKLNINFDYNKEKNRKVADVVGGKEAREKLKNLIDNDNTIQDLFNLATAHAKTQYEKFINDLLNTDKVLEIDGVTKGYPLYQVGKDGKRVQNKPLNVFKNIQLKKDSYGKEQLEGGKLGVVVNNQLKVGNTFVTLPEGTTYLQFSNDDFVTLQSRNLNEEESHTIMYLLSLANNNVPLNTITVDLPKKKDGSDYYYFLNNRKIESPLPVFFRKTQAGGESFSLLETMINYGLKSQGKNKKGEIYIQSGKVIFTTFEGQKKELDLTELDAAVKSNKFGKYSEKAGELFDFLLQKRFNVNNTMLANNPRFFYPKYSNGKLSFDVSKTYYEFLLNNTLTTSATKKEGYPERLQRNIIYNSKLQDKAVTQAKPKVTEEAKVPTTVQKPTKDYILERFIVNLKQRVDAFSKEKFDQLTTEIIEDSVYGNDALMLKLEDIGEKLTPEDVQYIIDGLLNPQVAEPVIENDIVKQINSLNHSKVNATDTVEITLKDDSIHYMNPMSAVINNEILFLDGNMADVNTIKSFKLVTSNKEEVKITVKKLTAAERLARLRGESVKLTTGSTPAADKRINPEDLLEKYIKDNIVQKNCK